MKSLIGIMDWIFRRKAFSLVCVCIINLTTLYVSPIAYGQDSVNGTSSVDTTNGAFPVDAASIANTFSWLFGIAVLILAIGLVLFMFTLGRRIPHASTSGTGRGSFEWYVGVTAASIALFGILITGVFVFMTLQINTTAERAARNAAITTARTTAQATVANSLPPMIDQAVRRAERHATALIMLGDYEGAQNISVDQPEPESRSVGTDERSLFALDIAESATIDIRAVGNGDFDPELYLFRMLDDGPRSIGFDDDTLGNLNSQIVMPLEMGQYYLEVREWSGRAGSFQLSANVVQSQ